MKKVYFLITCVLYFLLGLVKSYAQGELVPFTRRYPAAGDETIIRGDMRMIGNSILGVEDRLGGTLYSANDNYNDTDSRNNGVARGYIDVDSDPAFNFIFDGGLSNAERSYSGTINDYGSPISPNFNDTGTFSSSTAELVLENVDSPSDENCSSVLKAFLYWGGIYTVESDNNDGDNDTPLDRPDCPNCEFYTEVKILPPNATEYIDIKYENSGGAFDPTNPNDSLKTEVIFDGLGGRPYSFSATESYKNESYACVADVTSLFEHLQNNGEDFQGLWTVANVRATTGARRSGSGGGWSLVVVYEDPLANAQKSITLFDGYTGIEANGVGVQGFSEFNISGFETFPQGPVNVDVATITLEGDSGDLIGDQFQVLSQTTGNWTPMTYEDQPSSNNFYDSSIYSKGDLLRYPSSFNNLGFDSDHFRMINVDNELIGNSATSADFRLFTSGDAYANYFNAFSIEVIAPDLQVIKRAFDNSGNEFTLTDFVDLGDDINYVITIENVGNDDAVNVRFVDLLPINTVFTTDGFTFEGNVVTGAAPYNLTINTNATSTDELTGLEFDTSEISFDIPDGSLDIGETVEVRFGVSVVDDCDQLQDVCTNQIRNIADVSYSGVINGDLREQQSAFERSVCDDPLTGPTVVLTDQPSCDVPEEAEQISLCTDVVALSLEDANGFISYEWYYTGQGTVTATGGTRVTVNADGTPISDADQTITVDQAGGYRVEAIKDPSSIFTNCLDRTFFFQVELFDPNDPPANPFEELGEPLDPVCADDGTLIYEIQFCNDPILIDPQIPGTSTYSWQKHDGTCSVSVQNCVFDDACYVEVSNEENFTIDDTAEGEYKLTVEITGGCVFDYYFNVTPIDVDYTLNNPEPGCQDEVVFVIDGPLSSGGTVNYVAEFEVDGVLQNPDAGFNDRITIPRVDGTIVNVEGIISIVDADGNQISDTCSFSTGVVPVEFSEFEISSIDVTNAFCAFDDPNTDFDETIASVFVQTAGGNSPYTFELWQAGETSPTLSSGIIDDDDSYTFENLIPNTNYEVRVYANGTTSGTANNNCTAVANIDMEIPEIFTPQVEVTPLTCEPAALQITFEETTINSDDYTYTIIGINNSYSGDDIIYLDDLSNEPAPVDEDDPNAVGSTVDDRVVNYVDLSTSQDFTIRVTSPDGCTVNRIVTINPYDAPTITITSFENIDCEGDGDGLIQVEALQGGIPIVNPSYELFLDDGSGNLVSQTTQMTPIFSELSGGTYTVVVTNSDDCTAEVTQIITEPDPIVAPVITGPAFVCDGDLATLQITTDVSGGTTPYNYELFRNGSLFRSGTTAAEIATEGIPEGTYDLRVTDDNDCEVPISNEIEIQNLVLTLSNTTPTLQCGANPEPESQVTVSTVFSVAGADTVASYTIDSSTNTALIGTSNIDGIFTLTAGTHIIEVETTTFGCTETIDIVIDPIDEISVMGNDDFVCVGEDGQLTFNVVDFVNDYQYNLVSDTGSITPIQLASTTDNPLVITNPLAAGDYTLTVTDNITQCEATASVSIVEQPVLLNTVADIDSTCFGDPVTVVVNPTDGNIGNYEFSFGDDASFPATPVYQDSNEITFVPTGTTLTYRYLVRNRLTQCTETGTLAITQPEELILQSGIATDIICLDDVGGGGSGESDGSYAFELSGGVIGDTYTYTLYEQDDLTFSNPLDTKTITKSLGVNMTDIFTPIDPGSYRVVITDTTGCSYPLDMMLFDVLPAPNLGASNTFTFATCTNRVTLFFEIEDGTGSTNGDAFTIATRLDAEPIDFVDPSASSTDNIFQFGEVPFPTGYVPGTFNMNNETNRRIFAITDLDYDVVGDHIVILDTNTGCRYVVEYNTDASPSFEIIATPTPAGECDLETSGLVDLEVNNITGAPTIADIEIFRVGGDGTILATVPNVNLIAGPNTIPQISGLPTGNLRARVQDQANDCNATADFLIEIAPVLEVPIFTEVFEDCDDPAMLLDLTGIGGTPPYRFALSNFGDPIPVDAVFAEVTSLDPSAFVDINGDIDATLWIKDLNGCDNSARVQMEDYVLFAPDVNNLDPTNNCVINEGPRVTITDTSTWEGRPPYFYNVVGQGDDFIEITSVPFDILLPDEGNYDILFRDSIDCPATLNITVPSTDFELGIASTASLACTSNGVITVEITSGGVATDTYTFEISQFVDINGTITNPNTPGDNGTLAAGVFSEDFTIANAGLYEFRVTNATTQCEFFVTENVELPEQIALIAADDRLSCNADGSGEVVFEIMNHTGGVVSYEITNTATSALAADGTITNYGDASATITPNTGTGTMDATTGIVTATGFDAGTYNLVITAGTSGTAVCTATEEVVITEPDALTNVLQLVTPLTCNSGSAVLRAVATGGTGEYTYQLLQNGSVILTNNTGIFDEDVVDINPDPSIDTTYTVQVTDENGCPPLLSNLIDISDPVEPELLVGSAEIDCTGESTSFIATVNNAGATSSTDFLFALYLFDSTSTDNNKGLQIVAPQTSGTFNNIFAGSYVVEVTDGFGCSDTFNTIITDPDPVEFDNPLLTEAVSCDPTSETYEIQASGGTTATGNYTYEQFSAPISEGGVIVGAAQVTDIAVFNNLNGEVYFRVTDDNDCEDFITFMAAPVPDPVVFEIDVTTDPVCFGEAGGFVSIAESTSVSGGVGDYTYNIYTATDITFTTPLSNTTTPAVERVGENSFDAILPGDYVYVVTSGTAEDTCTNSIPFTIEQHPELTLETLEVTELGCPTENDAMAQLKITAGIGVGPFVYAVAPVGGEPVFVTEETDTTEAVFEFLMPGDYIYYIVDNGTMCPGPSGEFTIEDKELFTYTLEETMSDEYLCEEEIDGERTYTLQGGRAPYYYILSTDVNAATPNLEDYFATENPITTLPFVFTDGVSSGGIVTGSEVADVEDVGVLFTIENIIADTDYVIYFFDSGNGLIGEDLRICDPLENLFIYESEDLGNFDPLIVPDCENLDYTITINNTNPNINDEDIELLLYQIVDSNGDGIEDSRTQVASTGLTAEGVEQGEYEIYIRSLTTDCETLIEDRITRTLEEFEPVQFIDVDDEGNPIQPFIATNEINVYQLQATGGVNPGGINPYTYEVYYATSPFTDEQLTTVELVPVDTDGFFEVEQEGYFIFKVIDNYGDDGVSCFDITDDVGLNFIDIDVPNVFNPSSDDPLMSTWYPENLTTAFGAGTSPVDEDEAGLPTVITNTGGTIEGGSTTGGTTTDGVTMGGSVSGGMSTTNVPFTGAQSIVTIGGMDDGTGTITGGTTIITTFDGDNTTVEVYDNSTITGGITQADGTVTGGSYTTGSGVLVYTEEYDTAETVNITTGGTTTGEIATGGITTGGTTTYTGVVTSDDFGSSGAYITTGGTTENATITNSTTMGGTTVTISIPTTSTVPIIMYTDNTTVTGGITTNGITEGGTTSGGILIGGNNSTDDIPFIDYENMEVFVYDRYGRLLEQFKGLIEKSKGELGWDGTYQNKPLPSGDYWYLIKLNDSEGREFTGHFTLYRKTL